jgi:hypothetical protein
MNLDDIRSMGIVEARKLTKEVILAAVYEGITDTITTVEEDAQHNRTRQEDKTYLRWDGSLLGTKVTTWTYHNPKVGNVDKIETREFYEDDSPKSVLISRQDKDGKEQPVVIQRQAFARPIAEPIGEL